MSAAENKQIISTMFAELSKGNAAAFLDAMADDVKFTLQGATRFSGTFNGKQELMAKLFEPLTAVLEEMIALTPYNLIADGDYVAMQSQGKAMTKSGRPYNNSYCQIFRIVGGKVKEVTEYLDTALVDDVFGK
jgi:ketosteroid isomerase-like protein